MACNRYHQNKKHLINCLVILLSHGIIGKIGILNEKSESPVATGVNIEQLLIIGF